MSSGKELNQGLFGKGLSLIAKQKQKKSDLSKFKAFADDNEISVTVKLKFILEGYKILLEKEKY